MQICPSCRREISDSSAWMCPYCEHILNPDVIGAGDAMIVGELDDDDEAEPPTFVQGPVKSYLFYGSGKWKQDVQAILEAPASAEPVYPSEMTADDAGEGVDPDDVGPVDAIDSDTQKIPIPAPAPPAPQMNPRAKKLFDQAEVERGRGDFVAAHRNLKLALTFDPQNVELKKLLAEVAKEVPKDRKAPAKFSAVQGLTDRATEREKEGDLDGAIELLERALRSSKDPAIYNRLGVILAIRKKDYHRGREMVERALELAPDNETYRHNLSKILTHAATKDLQKGRDQKGSGGGGGLFGIFGKKK